MWNGGLPTIFLGNTPRHEHQTQRDLKKNTWHFFFRGMDMPLAMHLGTNLFTINAGTMKETVRTHWPNLLSLKIVDLRVPIWVQYVWHGLKLFSTHQNFRGGPNHHGPTASSKRIECYKILRNNGHHTESTTHTQHSWSSYVIKCKLTEGRPVSKIGSEKRTLSFLPEIQWSTEPALYCKPDSVFWNPRLSVEKSDRPMVVSGIREKTPWKDFETYLTEGLQSSMMVQWW